MSLKNFLLLEGTLAAAGAGDVILVDGPEGHHGAKVMRLRAGESVLVTDTHGHQAAGEVCGVAKSSFEVRLSQQASAAPDPEVRLTLVQALAKGGRDETAVETATELGVDRIIAWQAERSVARWNGDKITKGIERWRATVHAAVKQARRATIPAVGEVVSSRELEAAVREAVAEGCLVLVLHETAEHGLTPVLAELSSARNSGTAPPEVWAVVGPEGGISDSEASALREAGARVTLLGREIMRASSAGPAALAALCGALGRWA